MLHELFDDHLEIDAKSLGDADSDSDLLNPLPTCKGVIFFADSNDKPIQVLTAANIRRTAKARLTCPEQTTPTKRADIASITAKVYYRYCYNNFKSSLEYYRITKALYPDSYRKLLSLPKQSFVKICLSSKWPFFAVTDNPMACKDEKVFGPFATRRSANEYALSLNNAFLLCRKPDLAASGSDLASCPYYQMEICPGPCMGRIPPEDYYGRVDKAIKAASGDARKQIEEFEVCMKQHSERMEFELADQKKKAIGSLCEMTRGGYRWTKQLCELSVLHVDLSAKTRREKQRKKTQLYAAYLLRADGIMELGDFAIDDVASFYDAFGKSIEREFITTDRRSVYENMSLMSYFLYRSKPAGLWLSSSDGEGKLLALENISKSMCRKFEIETD